MIPLHCIQDNFTAIPLHLQAQNKAFLGLHLDKCWTVVLSRCCPGGKVLLGKQDLCHVDMDQWLEACEQCFSLACAPIFLSTGGANFLLLKHQQYTGQGRSIYLLKGRILAFTNPLRPHLKSNSSLSIIAVTPELTKYLLILLLIILPISIGVRALKGQHHSYGQTHVWVIYHKQHGGHNRWLFNENHMNADLEDVSNNTFGFPLTCRTLHGMAFNVLWAWNGMEG